MEAEQRISILVVDDVPEKLIATEAILEELGQNIVLVGSGREALRALLNQDFAVILLDVNMPEMDGFETASLIRQRARSEHTPIIFITAFSDETHVNQGYSLGAVDYILTPVVPEVLRAKVAVFVDLFRKNELVKRQAEERIAFAREQAARAAAEKANRRSAFLADASTVLARSLDFAATVRSAARVAVPTLGDLCIVAAADSSGRLRQYEVAWSDGRAAQFKDEGELFPLGAQAKSAIQQVFAAGEPLQLADLEPESARADRKYRSAAAAPLIARGKTLGAMLVAVSEGGSDAGPIDLLLVEDLAGRAALAIDNARLYQEISDGNRRKDEFLAMLGHELRNPLGAVSNALHCLEFSGQDEELVAEARNILNRQFKHVSRLVDDLLDVSRITQGKVQLRREVIDLRRVIEGAVSSSRSFIADRDHELSVSLPDETVRLQADPTRLEQVLSNLLNNAAKYSEPKGHIILKTEVLDHQVRVHIKDSGIGIDPELLPKVFDLFTQADRSLDRSQGGLGIGLTLARSLVHLHGGELSAHSDGLGKGSEFTVSLPRLVDYPLNDASSMPAPAAAKIEPRRILVVDDNADLALALKVLLKRNGHEVHVAGDGHEAIRLAPEIQPQAAIIDIGLPGMNGLEVARHLRQLPGFDRVVLIAMTGYGQPEDRARSRAAGFDHHLVKPVPPDAIQRILAAMEPAQAVSATS